MAALHQPLRESENMANHMDVDVVTTPSSANQTKDQPESPSEEGGGGKKRKSADPPSSTEDIENAHRKNAKKPREKRDIGPGRMCHQCHQKREFFLSCTFLRTKKVYKKEKLERCGIVFCDGCLLRRYDQNARDIARAGPPADSTKRLGHDTKETYFWKCPVCNQNCNCSTHRKASGLPLAGSVGTYAKEHGITIQQVLQDPIAFEAAQATSKARRVSGAPSTQNAKEGTEAVDGLKGDAANKNGVVTNGKEKKLKDKNTGVAETLKEPAENSKEKGNGMVDKMKKPEKASKPKAKAEKPKKEKKAAGEGKEERGQGKTKTLAIKPSHPVANSVKVPVMKVSTIKVPPPPKPFVKRPKLVPDPEFEFIAISHSLSVIDARLRIREFVLRFEKTLKLLAKYVHIINDPNSEWTNLTYKNLITCLLVLIQSDNNPTINPDVAFESVAEIKKKAADDPQLWEVFKNTLETVFYVDHIEDFTDEGTKLEMINMLLDLALGSTAFRHRMDQDLLKEKEIHQNTIKEVKDLRAKWEEEKQKFQKERLLLAQGERAGLEDRYTKTHSAHKKLVALAEQREWFASRKLNCRTTPLGIDSKGNVYHHFIQRDQKEEDWGQWVVVQKNPDLPHPSGVLPKMETNPPTKEGDDDGDLPDLPEPADKETVKERIWYAVSGSADIRRLGDWVQYQADLIKYNKAMAEYERSAAAAAAVIPSLALQSAGQGVDPFSKATPFPEKPIIPQSPSRQVLAGVHVPPRTPTAMSKMLPEESWTEEGIKSLVSQLHKIAEFLGLSEEGADHLVK